MKVLVTGASGFFGCSLVPALKAASHEAITFGRRQGIPRFAHLNIEHRRGDISDSSSLTKAFDGIDVVIHMAGLVSYRKTDYLKLYQSNVVGTANVMQAALSAGVGRVIHMSSIAGMGIPPEGTVGTEGIEYNLSGRGLHYCDTKHGSELKALSFFTQGLPVIILEPGITFGEGDTHPHHHTIFRSMQKGGQIGYPKGGVMFSDIQDVVRTTINAMSQGRPGERYVVGSANLTFRDSSIALSKVIGGRIPVFPIPGAISELAGVASEAIVPLFGQTPKLTWQVAWLSQHKIFFSSDKAMKELGHKQTPFEETIRRTAPYYLGCATSENSSGELIHKNCI
ncbi:MAG TPA: NAD-dependent epimerase/dehydratase family protein [Candidatus Obscuribacterales bacterium]